MLSDAGDDPIAVARAVEGTVLHGASKLQTSVRGADPGRTALHFHCSKECADPMLDDLFDGARPPIGCIARHPHSQSIAVHHSTHFGRRKKDAVLHSLDPQKAVTGAVRAHLALDHTAGMSAARSPALRSGRRERSAAALDLLRLSLSAGDELLLLCLLPSPWAIEPCPPRALLARGADRALGCESRRFGPGVRTCLYALSIDSSLPPA